MTYTLEVCSLQSPFFPLACSLHFTLSLHFTSSLQFSFYTDQFWKGVNGKSIEFYLLQVRKA